MYAVKRDPPDSERFQPPQGPRLGTGLARLIVHYPGEPRGILVGGWSGSPDMSRPRRSPVSLLSRSSCAELRDWQLFFDFPPQTQTDTRAHAYAWTHSPLRTYTHAHRNTHTHRRTQTHSQIQASTNTPKDTHHFCGFTSTEAHFFRNQRHVPRLARATPSIRR